MVTQSLVSRRQSTNGSLILRQSQSAVMRGYSTLGKDKLLEKLHEAMVEKDKFQSQMYNVLAEKCEVQ